MGNMRNKKQEIKSTSAVRITHERLMLGTAFQQDQSSQLMLQLLDLVAGQT